MGHAQKRLYSTATKLAIAPSHVKHFPPKESLKRSQTPFDAEVWASLQPPPKSALSAFAHRIGLGNILTSEKTIQQACVHPSFLSFHEKYYPKETLPASNGQLAIVGNSLMGLFASEYLHASYPHLPLRVLKAAVSAHVGPLTCASVAQEMGAAPLLRWHRQVRRKYFPPHRTGRLISCTACYTNATRSDAYRRPFIYTSSNNRSNISRTLTPCRPKIRAFFLSQS
jgi:large subunit ribosomal protein L44